MDFTSVKSFTAVNNGAKRELEQLESDVLKGHGKVILSHSWLFIRREMNLIPLKT